MDYYDNMMIELRNKRNKEEKKNILTLLDQMIEKAKADDVHYKISAYEEGRLEDTIGDSWMLHHLKVLKELVEEDLS